MGLGSVAAHGDEAHGFGAAGDDDPGQRRCGYACRPGQRPRDRTSRRRVHGYAGHLNGQAGTEGGEARHVEAGLAFKVGATEDHALDFALVELGNALQRAVDGDGGQVVGAGGGEGAFRGAAHGRPTELTRTDSSIGTFGAGNKEPEGNEGPRKLAP